MLLLPYSEMRGLLTLSRVRSFSPFLPGLQFQTMQDLSAEALRRNWSFDEKFKLVIVPLWPWREQTSSWFEMTGVRRSEIVVSCEAAASFVPEGL